MGLVWGPLVAAGLSALAALFHGSRTTRYLAPLRSSDLPKSLHWLLPLCWDAVTLLFVGLAIGFALVGVGLADRGVARFAAGLAAGIALLAGYATIRAGMPPWRHPATYIMGVAAALGALA